MAQTITAAALKSLLDAQATFALIDIREPGEYNDSHIPGASLVPRRQLEFRLGRLVPYRGTRVIVCDDDGRRAPLAAATLEGMGFRQVAVLEGGINRWTTVGYPTEWGVNVPSKDFGEKMQVVHQIAEMHPEELDARQRRRGESVPIGPRPPRGPSPTTLPGTRPPTTCPGPLHLPPPRPPPA